MSEELAGARAAPRARPAQRRSPPDAAPDDAAARASAPPPPAGAEGGGDLAGVLDDGGGAPLDRAAAYYTCEATAALNVRYGDLQHKTQDLEASICTELIKRLLQHTPALTAAAAAVAELDCLCGFAAAARELGYVRPTLVRESVIAIEGGARGRARARRPRWSCGHARRACPRLARAPQAGTRSPSCWRRGASSTTTRALAAAAQREEAAAPPAPPPPRRACCS